MVDGSDRRYLAPRGSVGGPAELCELSTPGIALQVADRPGLQDFGVRLTSEAWLLKSSDDVYRLLELIENPARTRPVYVAALPDGEVNPATAFVNCGSLARRCLGIAHVVILPSPLSFELTDQVGKEHSVFSGAVRSYFPGFAVEDQVPRKHPLALPARIVDWPGGGAKAFEDLLVRRGYEYSIRRPDLEDRLPSFTQARKIALSRHQVDLERDGDQRAIIVNLQAQNQELSREAETWEALATEEVDRRARLQDEADQLKTQNDWMRSELDRLRQELQKSTGGRADAPIPFPADLGNVGEWAHQAVPGRLTILPRAIKAAKQGLYRETNHVFKALLVLANEYRDMKLQGGAEKKASLASKRQCRNRHQPRAEAEREARSGARGSSWVGPATLTGALDHSRSGCELHDLAMRTRGERPQSTGRTFGNLKVRAALVQRTGELRGNLNPRLRHALLCRTLNRG